MTYHQALAALADQTRREIFEQLVDGPRSVGELAQQMPVSRPAVSQHLKVLKAAGLVSDAADGTRRVYHIDPNGLGELRQWLDRFWDHALEAFKAHIDENKDSSHAAKATIGKHPRRSRSKERTGQRRRRTRL